MMPIRAARARHQGGCQHIGAVAGETAKHLRPSAAVIEIEFQRPDEFVRRGKHARRDHGIHHARALRQPSDRARGGKTARHDYAGMHAARLAARRVQMPLVDHQRPVHQARAFRPKPLVMRENAIAWRMTQEQALRPLARRHARPHCLDERHENGSGSVAG